MKNKNSLEHKLNQNYLVDNQLWNAIQKDLPVSSKSLGSIFLGSILSIFLICLPLILIDQFNSTNLFSKPVPLVNWNELDLEISHDIQILEEIRESKQPIHNLVQVQQQKRTVQKLTQNDGFNIEPLTVESIPINFKVLENNRDNISSFVKPSSYIKENSPIRKWEFMLSTAYGFGNTTNSTFISNLGTSPVSIDNRNQQHFVIYAGIRKGIWTIETGIGLRNIKQQSTISFNQSIESPLFTVVNPNFKTSSGRNVMLIRINRNPHQLKDTTIQGSLFQKAIAISIPIRLSMKVPISRRLSFDFSTGFQTSFGNRNHSMQYSTEIDENILDQVSIASNNIELKPLSQIGVNYKLNSNFNLSYKMQMTNIELNNYPFKRKNPISIECQYLELEYEF